VSIYTMTAPVASRVRGTSESTQPSAGNWPVQVPQLVAGPRTGSMFQPAAGIQADPTFIRNRVVEVAKPGSPPRGAPR
jgi:hypothetical protein